MFSKNMAEKQQKEISSKESDGQNCFITGSNISVITARCTCLAVMLFLLSKQRTKLAGDLSANNNREFIVDVLQHTVRNIINYFRNVTISDTKIFPIYVIEITSNVTLNIRLEVSFGSTVTFFATLVAYMMFNATNGTHLHLNLFIL